MLRQVAMRAVYDLVSSFLCLFILMITLHGPANVKSSPCVTSVKPDMTVQLAFFSGLPDPQWNLTSTSPFYDSVFCELKNLHAGNLPPILGYKGFVVTMFEKGLHVIREVPRHSDKVLENLLLNTAPRDIVDDKIKELVRKSIEDNH